MRSVQLPFTQGSGSHLSTGSTSQNLPVTGGTQVQVKFPTVSEHVPHSYKDQSDMIQ